MKNGGLLIPPPTSFAPCFRPVPHKDRPYQLGFDQASLSSEPKVIRGLIAESAAAKAGLREGDVVVSSDDVLQVQKDASQSMHLSVKRGESVAPITYVPRGEPIDSYRWDRVVGVKDAQCKF